MLHQHLNTEQANPLKALLKAMVLQVGKVPRQLDPVRLLDFLQDHPQDRLEQLDLLVLLCLALLLRLPVPLHLPQVKPSIQPATDPISLPQHNEWWTSSAQKCSELDQRHPHRMLLKSRILKRD